ncbi:MAG: nuclear transport factor 2 family protein [Candidatus Thorarchaeota archaeon]|nr:MAG: nuclear transport factor 2 family protein [Candidatus Thorarchaeota archaeon]
MTRDEENIERVLRIFVDGLRTLDYDKISEVFYEDGMSIGVGTGGLSWVARDHWKEMREEMIKAGKNPVDEWGRFEIRSIKIIGNAASVIVDLWFGDGGVTKEKYVDFYHMLKVDEQWRIVSKIYPSPDSLESTP